MKMQTDKTGYQTMKKSIIASAIALSLSGHASCAIAAEAEVEAESHGIEVIEVTSRKRVESIQSIPIAITVLSDVIIDDGNLDTIVDFMQLVPNMALPMDGFTSSDISIRGSGRAKESEDPGVGINRDGVYIGGLLTSFSNFYDIERIEIMRGPQAGLYGRNAVGGALNITTTKPEFYQDGYLDVQFGNNGRQEYRGAGNLTLVEDKLAIRVSGLYLDQDEGFNYVENQDLYLDAFENKSARVRVLYTPTDDLEFLTTFETFTAKGGINQPVIAPNAESGTINPFTPPLPGVQSDDTEHLNFDFRPSKETEQFQFIQEVNWDLGHGVVTGIFSYRDTESDATADDDASIYDFRRLTSDAEQQSTFLELRYNGQFGKWNVTTGITHLDEDLQLNNIYQFGGEIGVDIEQWYTDGVFGEDVANIGIPELIGAPLSAVGWTDDLGNGGGFSGELGDAFPAHYINEQHLKSTAVFLEVNYAYSDALDLWFNVRYTEDEKTIVFDQSTKGCEIACAEVFSLFWGSDLVFAFEETQSWDNVSPSVGLNYEISDDFMVYAKYSTGFKAGGFNNIASSPDVIAFDSEETAAYEIGMKSIWWDNQFLLNATAFQQTRTDALVEAQDPGMAINFIGVNAGEIDAKGIELEMVLMPLAGLDINVAFGYLDSEFTDFVANPGTEAEADFTGNRPPLSFKYSVSAVISYSMPITEDLELFTFASYYNAQDAFLDNANVTKQDEPETVDLRIGVKAEDWKVSLYVDNAFDNRYIAWESDPAVDAYHRGFFAAGRTYGVQLAYYFE